MIVSPAAMFRATPRSTVSVWPVSQAKLRRSHAGAPLRQRVEARGHLGDRRRARVRRGRGSLAVNVSGGPADGAVSVEAERPVGARGVLDDHDPAGGRRRRPRRRAGRRRRSSRRARRQRHTPVPHVGQPRSSNLFIPTSPPNRPPPLRRGSYGRRARRLTRERGRSGTCRRPIVPPRAPLAGRAQSSVGDSVARRCSLADHRRRRRGWWCRRGCGPRRRRAAGGA